MIDDQDVQTVGEPAHCGSPGFLPHRTAADADVGLMPVAAPWQIDGFEITGQLGQGGMGTVWRAVQLSTGREVAIKLLHAGLAPSERARRRFEREIELTASLQHPHIARVYDSGVKKGAYYYAMELIEGVAVDQYVKDHRLPRRDILKLFCSIAEAVQYAHQRGVIHRDLKPTNILVDPQGDPHVLDFGVAKLFDIEDAGQSVSVAGEILGTPAFMSPEQAEGSPGAVDIRSDVYSLGAVLYLLLIGQLPHDVTGTYLAVLRRVSEQEILRPSKARSDIGSELEAILLKALSRDVESRYSSAGTLAEDVTNYLAGEPLLARKRTAFYFLRKKLWKHRYVAAAVLAVLMALGGLAVRDVLRTRAERDFATASAAKERAANQLAQAANRTAQLHLADALLSWGDSLAAADHWESARNKYWQARDIWTALGLPTTAADAGLFNSYQRAPLPLAQFQVPPGKHLAASFTPDGIAACSGKNGTITSMDPSTGQQQTVPGQVNGAIREGYFSDDGKSVILLVNPLNQLGRLDSQCAAVIQDFRGKSPPRAYLLPGTAANLLSISPDARFAACNLDPSGAGHVAVLSTLEQPSIQMELTGNAATAFYFSNDSLSLYVADRNGRLSEYQPLQPVPQRHIDSGLEGISVIRAMPGTNRLLVGSSLGRLAVLDLTGRIIRNWVAHPASITHLAVSQDGIHALSSDADGLLRLWDTDSASPLFSVQAHSSPLASLAISGDGTHALSADATGSIKLWQIRPNEQVVSSIDSSPTALALSPDCQLGVYAQPTGSVALIDLATGRCLYRLVLAKRPVGEVCFSADGLELFALQANEVYHWNVLDPSHLTHFDIGSIGAKQPTDATLTHAQLSTQGNVALHWQENRATIWDTRKAQLLQVLSVGRIRAAALSEDGQTAAICGDDDLQLFDANTGNVIAQCKLPEHEMPLQLAVSDDARSVLISTNSENLYLWNNGGQDMHLLASESGMIRHIRFSPDGHFAVTGGDDAVKLWDIPNARELRTLSQYENSSETFVALGGDSSILLAHVSQEETSQLQLVDLRTPLAYRSLAARVSAAFGTLATNPDNAEALYALGEWYAFRGESQWAAKLLDAARQRGVGAQPIVLARLAWKLGQPDQAAQLFRRMLEGETSPAERVYLTLCLRAADDETKSRSPLTLNGHAGSQ